MMMALQAIRIELGETVDVLSGMPRILEELGLTRLLHCTVLRDWFEKIPMKTYRVFLGASTEKRSAHAVIDATASTAASTQTTTVSEHTTVFGR